MRERPAWMYEILGLEKDEPSMIKGAIKVAPAPSSKKEREMDQVSAFTPPSEEERKADSVSTWT